MEMRSGEGAQGRGACPRYEFEPSTDVVLDACCRSTWQADLLRTCGRRRPPSSRQAAREKAADGQANEPSVDRLDQGSEHAGRPRSPEEGNSEIVGGSNASLKRTREWN